MGVTLASRKVQLFTANVFMQCLAVTLEISPTTDEFARHRPFVQLFKLGETKEFCEYNQC